MKNHNLLNLIFLPLIAVLTLVCCNSEDEANRWYDTIENGTPFLTGTGAYFYYIDEEGHDLLDIDVPSTYPATSIDEKNPNIADSIENKRFYVRGGNSRDYNAIGIPGGNGGYWNSVDFNNYKGLTRFYAFAYGDARQKNSRFYIWFKGKADVVDMVYSYQKRENSGFRFSVSIESMKVNGVEVPKGLKRNIFLIKKEDGTTEVKFNIK